MTHVADRHAARTAPPVRKSDGGAPPADIAALEQQAELVTLQAGTVLCTSGSPVEDVFIIREGRVHLAVRTPNHGRHTVAVLGPGGVVGDIAVLCRQPSTFDAIAETDVIAYRLHKERLVGVLRSSPSLNLRWTASIARRLDATQQRLATLVTKDLAAQIATLLMEFAQNRGGAPVVEMSHRTIADLLGARRQSVSRVLGRFRKSGLVRSRYGAVELLDPQAMGDVASGARTVDEARATV